jgi:hypothetical protein
MFYFFLTVSKEELIKTNITVIDAVLQALYKRLTSKDRFGRSADCGVENRSCRIYTCIVIKTFFLRANDLFSVKFTQFVFLDPHLKANGPYALKVMISEECN